MYLMCAWCAFVVHILPCAFAINALRFCALCHSLSVLCVFRASRALFYFYVFRAVCYMSYYVLNLILSTSHFLVPARFAAFMFTFVVVYPTIYPCIGVHNCISIGNFCVLLLRSVFCV